MKVIFFILIIFIFYSPCFLLAQNEETTLLTYYPAPYGFYDQMYAITYTDRNNTNYFLDLDGPSRIFRLNIGVPTNNSEEKAVLQIGETLASGPNDQAAIYAKTINTSRSDIQDLIQSGSVNDYSAIYGETNQADRFGDGYGVYGYSHSSAAGNRGVYGLATGSNQYDYGVFGVGDDCGVVGGTGKIGIAGFFGKDTVPVFPNFNCALYGRGEDVTVSGTTRRAHGIYARTGANDKYGGYFESGNNSGNGVRAYSSGHNGIRASSGNAGYGGYFESSSAGVYLKNDSSGTDYAEITSGDDDLSIFVGEAAGGHDAKFTVMAPYDKNTLLRVRSYRTDGTAGRYIELYCDDDDNTAFIRADKGIEIQPSTMATWSHEKWIRVMGSIRWKGVTVHSDLAEPFELTDKDKLELGDVVEVDKENKGHLRKTTTAYANAAGIISSKDTAAMVIGYRKDGTNDKPLALRGRVLCKADASFGEIKPGDLLVSSPVPGYAMKASPVKEINGQRLYGNGVIIGKALEPLKEGKGKILVLLTR